MRNKLKFTCFAYTFILSASLTMASSTTVITNHFDNAEDVKKANEKWNFYEKISAKGKGCAQALRNASFRLPKDADHGFVTLWIYEPLNNAKPITAPLRGINIVFSGNTSDSNKKKKRGGIQLKTNNIGESSNFLVPQYGLTYDDTTGEAGNPYMLRTPGWNRFDFVKKDKSPCPIQVYFNGRLFAQTPDNYKTMNAIGCGTTWGTNFVYIDEFTFNPDPRTIQTSSRSGN